MEVTQQFTVENIETVLHQLYYDVQSQVQANHFLMLAQQSPEAWDFAWQLLHPSKAHEVKFFGASTLQMKILKNWNEIPQDQYDTLRRKLLHIIFSYLDGPKVILTRLCIAMSSFVIQTVVNFWPCAVADLMAAFQPQSVPNASPEKLAYTLLDLLTILSEEINTVPLSHSKSEAVRFALESNFGMVREMIECVLAKTTAPVDIYEIALKCYSGWAQIGTTALECHSLLILSFDAVYRGELCHTALETLSNIATHQCSHMYPNLILAMVENIAKFDNLLSEAIAEKDTDKCCSIYSMVLAVADTHSNLLLDTLVKKPEKKDDIMKLINYVLQCSNSPGQYPIDEICSEMPFGFWYTLQDHIVSSQPQSFEKLLLIFHPIFQALLDTYITKVKYPTDEDYQHWSTEEQESFRIYRQDVGDSIMFCYNILRHGALANLLTHLQIAITTAVKNPKEWQYLEACLFAFREMAENIDLGECCYIPQFMAQLPNIPLQHLKVISALMETIGAYAEWINNHPDVMHFVIPLLLMGLQNADMAPSATFALKDITYDCHDSLKQFAEQILLASQEALKGDILKSRERVRLMSTVGHMLSILPYENIMSYLDTLVTPIIDTLQKLTLEEPGPNVRTSIVLHVHMLSMLFSTLDINRHPEGLVTEDYVNPNSDKVQPIFLVLQRVMPMLSALSTKWEANEQIVEALCDALKRAVSTLLENCKPFLQEIIQIVLHLYQHCPLAAVLDMAKQVLLLFESDQSQRSHLSLFFSKICSHTLQLTMSDFRENTTVIEIFLQLLTQIIKKAIVFFKEESINQSVIFECAVAALSLPEKQTVKASASFITEFIMHSREEPNMLAVVNSQGETLIAQILRVISGASPRSVVEFMPDILISLNKKYFDNLCRWMNTFAHDGGFLPPHVTQQQREQFARLVLRERTNKRKLKETVTEFSLLCRGLIGTEYGAQTSVT